jgi:endonuclease/exonuclease/phosphatase family metal-dependent hydrolase
MILGTYNVESMFERPKVMNLDTWEDGKYVLEDYTKLNELIQSPNYTDAIKTEILDIMKKYKGLLAKGESNFITLCENHGKLLKRPRGKPVEIVATGRNEWIGWFELTQEPVNDVAIQNMARTIGLLNADVLCTIEVENRQTLTDFNGVSLKQVGTKQFSHMMLIDGNDLRGIDVGLMTKQGYDIVRILSHIDDQDEVGKIFSRDCAEYDITTPKGNKMLLLINHFKSKGYGSTVTSNSKRLRQAKRVRTIYDQYLNSGYEYIAIAGDLNDIPNSAQLDPLIQQGSTLTDIMVHPKFIGDGHPGTFENGTKNGKFDYILMSPKLSNKVIKGGIERKGVWGGKNGDLFPHIPTITKSIEAASDHAALWVELDI